MTQYIFRTRNQKAWLGLYGAGQTPLTGVDQDHVFQAHGKISTDVTTGWYCGTLGTIEMTCSQTGNTSVFGACGELDIYAAASTTLTQGNYAGVYGDLETSGTLIAPSSGCWMAGLAANLMGPGTAFTIPTNSRAAAIVANVGFAALPTIQGTGILAGIIVRKNWGTLAVPYGLAFVDTPCTCDILLSQGIGIYSKATSPNGALTAPKGSLCVVGDGSSTSTRLWINTDGATTWTSVTTAA